jgi:serine/threonine protein kinase/Tol biopolymer transport system component
MSLAPGFLLGDYEVLAPLGAGGMGEVYRARDARLGREVAIKVLPRSWIRDPERLRRFELEARAAAALNHPNILVVYQLGNLNGLPYLVSELLEGETVRERLARGPLPVRKVVDYGIEIAHGLEAAHRKGIIHRDLKPENLFLTNNGHIKILDFGLARVILPDPEELNSADTLAERHTTPGLQLGTVGYMSPEQVRGVPAVPQSDLFSLTVVLREMLTAKRTFQKPTSVETMTAILNEEPAPVSEMIPNIPPGLQRILDRGLDKDPEQRFQSASDMAFALEALSDPAVASASGPSRTRSQTSTPRRLLLSAAALVVIAALGFLVYLAAQPASAPTVSNYVQLTHDGLQKTLIGTDGARLYLSLTTSAVNNLAVLDLADHDETRIALPASDMQPVTVSPDGSAVLVIQGRGFPFRGAFWSVPVIGGSPRRLGDLVGTAGAWSADRQRLAYADGGNLYLAGADGSSPRRIRSLDRPIDSIAWSPDGKTLSLSASQGFNADIGTHSEWEIGSDGSNLHQLLSGWHNPSDECCGAWTPDGKFFVFASGGQIWALAREGKFFHRKATPTPLTASPMTLSSPLVSRDGSKLFVVGATYRGELTECNPQTGQFAPFLGGISAEYVSFSRDRQWAAWVSYPDGVLWRGRVDGTEQLQLTQPPLHPALPRWSPDGKNLVFFTFPQSATQPARIYEVAANGGSPAELMPDAAMHQQDPNWSPDGTRLVFSGDQNDAAANPSRPTIHILDLATRAISDVPGSFGLFSPRWSPDGKFLLALTADSRTLRQYDFAAQTWRTVTEGNFGWLNYSHDGRYAYSLDFTGDGAVVRVRLEDGRMETVTSLKGFVTTGQYGGSLSLTPQDDPLLLRDRGTQDVYAVDFTER